MPATLRSNTDYEHWLRYSNPGYTRPPKPNYSQVQNAGEMDLALEYRSPMSNPQIYISRGNQQLQLWENRPPFSTIYIILICVIIVAVIFIETRSKERQGAYKDK